MKVQPTTRQLIEMLYERFPELFDRPAREWVGLTDEEFQMIYDMGRTPAGMIEMAEAKLREKNAIGEKK